MNYVKIPKSYKVGGQLMEVRQVERCDDNCMGQCHVTAGWIEIADIVNKNDKQSEGSKHNTFYHELTHSILKTMGSELNDDEKFVCCFSSFLTEAMEKAYFEEEEEK